MVEAQGVHQDVAHHIGSCALGLLAGGHAVALDASGEEIVAEGVDDEAVDFLRHIHVEGTGACYEMSQLQSALLRDNGSGHRRGEVVDNYDHVGGLAFEQGVELGHHAARNLVETGAVDSKEHRWTRHLQVVEDRGFERGVVLTSCIN